MKRILIGFGVATLITLFFISCQKEEDTLSNEEMRVTLAELRTIDRIDTLSDGTIVWIRGTVEKDDNTCEIIGGSISIVPIGTVESGEIPNQNSFVYDYGDEGHLFDDMHNEIPKETLPYLDEILGLVYNSLF